MPAIVGSSPAAIHDGTLLPMPHVGDIFFRCIDLSLYPFFLWHDNSILY
jgi:hypothetical protein